VQATVLADEPEVHLVLKLFLFGAQAAVLQCLAELSKKRRL
jgi:hypothetical protein